MLSRVNLKVISCLGHHSNPEYVNISKTFDKKVFLLARVIKSETAKKLKFSKIQLKITGKLFTLGKNLKQHRV